MYYLGALMAIRFFGLFIVMPLLALYAMKLKGANEFNVGIALGAYALSQIFLQIPFGKLADKYNKKIIIAVGLFLLFLGSIVCAFADNIYMLVFGRLLQGAGAIGGVVLAYMANLSDENNRAKIFARMGQFIAISFALSMILGPIIGAKYGVDKLFLITAFLALISIIIIFTKVPNENHITHHKESAKLIEVLKNKELLKLFFSGFMQKGLMSMFFMLTPIIFTKNLHWQKSELWKIYLAALVVGFFALPLGAILAEKKDKAKEVFLISAISITSALILFLINTPITIILAVIVFFFGFNLIEPVLQSFVSKLAKAHEKATALSTSNTIQYLGIFLGGAISGYFLKINALNLLLIITITLGILWIIAIYKTKALKKLKIVEYTTYDKEFIKALKEEKNVYDFYEKDGKLIVRYI